MFNLHVLYVVPARGRESASGRAQYIKRAQPKTAFILLMCIYIREHIHVYPTLHYFCIPNSLKALQLRPQWVGIENTPTPALEMGATIKMDPFAGLLSPFVRACLLCYVCMKIIPSVVGPIPPRQRTQHFCVDKTDDLFKPKHDTFRDAPVEIRGRAKSFFQKNCLFLENGEKNCLSPPNAKKNCLFPNSEEKNCLL